MSKEIVIGADIKPIFNSISLWYMGDAKENTVFYILVSNILDMRIYIYKNSEEGKEIGKWLSCEDNRNNDSVQRKALELVVPRLTVDDFLEFIDEKSTSSYKEGYTKAQYDIRKALGI